MFHQTENYRPLIWLVSLQVVEIVGVVQPWDICTKAIPIYGFQDLEVYVGAPGVQKWPDHSYSQNPPRSSGSSYLYPLWFYVHDYNPETNQA